MSTATNSAHIWGAGALLAVAPCVLRALRLYISRARRRIFEPRLVVVGEQGSIETDMSPGRMHAMRCPTWREQMCRVQSQSISMAYS